MKVDSDLSDGGGVECEQDEGQCEWKSPFVFYRSERESGAKTFSPPPTIRNVIGQLLTPAKRDYCLHGPTVILLNRINHIFFTLVDDRQI